MFTAALLTIAKAQKHPKCPSTDEWIKMCVVCIHIYVGCIHTHTHTYTYIHTYIQWNTTYSIIKNKIFPFAKT